MGGCQVPDAVLQHAALLLQHRPFHQQRSDVLFVAAQLVGQCVLDELEALPASVEFIFGNSVEKYQRMEYLEGK